MLVRRGLPPNVANNLRKYTIDALNRLPASLWSSIIFVDSNPYKFSWFLHTKFSCLSAMLALRDSFTNPTYDSAPSVNPRFVTLKNDPRRTVKLPGCVCRPNTPFLHCNEPQNGKIGFYTGRVVFRRCWLFEVIDGKSPRWLRETQLVNGVFRNVYNNVNSSKRVERKIAKEPRHLEEYFVSSEQYMQVENS